MYKPYCIGEEVPFIGSISNGIKIRYSKVIEVNEEEKTISLENAMKLKFVKEYEEWSAWDKYINLQTNKSVLVRAKF
jgi:hypothetical protein